MTPYIVEKTDLTPEVILNPKENIFHIVGESRPEHVGKFYDPILNWLEGYHNELYDNSHKDAERPKEIIFVFKLEYFNSSSIKFVYDILKKLEDFNDHHTKVKIHWHYDAMDDDMFENGEEFSKIIRLPFELIKN